MGNFDPKMQIKDKVGQYKDEPLIGTKTPFDFRGDIYQGVQDFMSIDPELRKYLGFVPCHVSIAKNNVECEPDYKDSERGKNMIFWLNNYMEHNKIKFENDFTFVLMIEDSMMDPLAI